MSGVRIATPESMTTLHPTELRAHTENQAMLDVGESIGVERARGRVPGSYILSFSNALSRITEYANLAPIGTHIQSNFQGILCGYFFEYSTCKASWCLRTRFVSPVRSSTRVHIIC